MNEALISATLAKLATDSDTFSSTEYIVRSLARSAAAVASASSAACKRASATRRAKFGFMSTSQSTRPGLTCEPFSAK